MTQQRSPLRGLPLLWKILTPVLVMVLIVGPLAAYLITRDLSARAQAALDADLLGRVVDARARSHDRGLYLMESARLAANLQGMADAVANRDAAAATGLLQSVLALKTDLSLLVVVAPDGQMVAGFTREIAGAEIRPAPPATWDGSRVSEIVSGARERSIAVHEGALSTAVPVCSGTDACVPVGMIVAGTDLQDLLTLMADTGGGHAVGIYDPAGQLIASRGAVPSVAPVADELIRQRARVQDVASATIFAPFEVDAERLGSIGIAVPLDATNGISGGMTARLAILLFLAMAVVLGTGVLIARSVLRQVHELHVTSQALARGDLSRRAPVLADDEIGDLARVLNHMAAELQSSHELLETRVEQRTQEVRRLLEQRTEFFASLSHELRTPLAVILSQARMRRNPLYRKRRGSDADAWLVVESSAEQLLEEVNAVLDLARASSGRLEAKSVDVAIAEVLEPVRALFEPVATGHGLMLEVTVARDLPRVIADPRLLRDVLLNLVDNAVKYTPSGGRVGLSAAARNGVVDVSVADTGVGIPADVRDRIFEPFYRVPGAQTQHGERSTGLGLALAKQLVELQGATIRLEDATEGTVFTISLPRASD